MNRFFLYFFDKWWRPVIFWGITILLAFVGELSKNELFSIISMIIFGIGLLGLLVSLIFQFIKKRWTKGILTGIILIFGTIIAFVLFSIFIFIVETLDGDKWADNLKIPDNIDLNIPKGDLYGQIRPDSIINKKYDKTDFELYNSFQPGLYEFDFWTGKIERGVIYLKAYEITQEHALSKNRLPESSLVKVFNSTDSIMRFGTTTEFTIYEGDWGKPYAARFEVWYRPDNGGKERKLFQKNYKIEGWQR